MLESQPSDDQLVAQEGPIPDDIRNGLEYRVLEFVILAYKKMYQQHHYTPEWKENTFSAVLTGCLQKHRRNFARQTRRDWHIAREVYNDDEPISSGEADPDKASRIDIVLFTWEDHEEIKFPFECKLVDEDDSALIRLYIKKGLIDRYLTEKNYSGNSSWGGMVGYILQGRHDAIVAKLNYQIDRQIGCSTDHLQIQDPIAEFEAIYKSQHQRSNHPDPLTITHLFLRFQARINNVIQN